MTNDSGLDGGPNIMEAEVESPNRYIQQRMDEDELVYSL